MRKLIVPMHLDTMTDENLHEYIESAKKSGVDRIFLCGLGFTYLKTSTLYVRSDFIERTIARLQKEGFEVGVWIDGFGHGAILKHEKSNIKPDTYTPIEGINGSISKHGFCPMDESFVRDYGEGVEKVASFHPDFIMLDDDFRLQLRKGVYMGCFCKNHIKEYYKRLGEEVPREKLEELILTGGKNKYRTVYRELLRNTVFDFAKEVRRRVDNVDPQIRVGTCATCENWDYNGTDVVEMAKVFAGNTKPFARICGAPYTNFNIIPVVENSRLQFKWCREGGVEAMSEGDVYPRPRYNVPSKVLELFDNLLIANGDGDGILNYIYDYSQKPKYETGYVDRYIKNAPLREEIESIFKGKKPTGVKVFQQLHLIENWDMPKAVKEGLATRLMGACYATSRELLARNAIATCFEGNEYPLLLVGENAKYIDLEELKKGAILDVKAAEILKKRGVDTGFISEEYAEPDGEYFIAEDDTIRNINNSGLRAIRCDETAKVLSRFVPDNTPASYLYENEDGLKFFVLACDIYSSVPNANYFGNYYRQANQSI